MNYQLETVYAHEKVKQRITELGVQISNDYKNKELIIICVLKGAVYFTVDLSRELKIPFILDFISISNYAKESDQLGIVRIVKDLDVSITGKDILLIENMIDTGLTLNYLLRNLRTRDPLSIKVCTLLNVKARRIVDVPTDYVGFELPDIYAVGYGLDYQGKYRNMTDIAALKESPK